MRAAGAGSSTGATGSAGAGGDDLSRQAFRAALDAEREKWNRERDQLLDEIDGLTRERELLQSDMNREMGDQRSYYEGIIEMLQTQLADKERDAADADARYQSREYEVNKLKTYALTLEGQLNEWRTAGTQFDALARRYDDVEDARVYLENELQRLTTELMNAQNEARKASEDRNRLMRNQEFSQQRINELQMEREVLKADADRFRLGEDDGTKWKMRAVVLALELERLSNVFVGLNAEIDQVGLRYREMEKLYNNSVTEVNNIKASQEQSDRMRRDLEILRTQVSMLTEENDKLRNTPARSEAPVSVQQPNLEQIQMFQRQTEELRQENAQLQRRLMEIERDGNVRKREAKEIENLHQTIREMNRVNEEYRRELEQIRMRGDTDLRPRMQELENQIAMLVAENNRLQQEHGGTSKTQYGYTYSPESPSRQSQQVRTFGQQQVVASPRVRYVVRGPYDNMSEGPPLTTTTAVVNVPQVAVARTTPIPLARSQAVLQANYPPPQASTTSNIIGERYSVASIR
eukprot:TRINITY_DN1497_c0_g1_i4.p1 TRINITY_DN1497_c0_g1~~TRINITY_DN1497_c0_g1_i4.p1  ORF type:complete len:521 (-),score=138.83 TRINITY_DN1497_c0_g1_i4:63-1625(-)